MPKMNDVGRCRTSIGRQHTTDDINVSLPANLAADVSNMQTDIALQPLVAVFRRPDDVIAVAENTVASGGFAPGSG